MNRDVKIMRAGPKHPDRRRSAATMGRLTREEGARSHVEVVVDLGLKTNKLAIVPLTDAEAIKLIADLSMALDTVTRVNAEATDATA
jgi:hypothetical protein